MWFNLCAAIHRCNAYNLCRDKTMKIIEENNVQNNFTHVLNFDLSYGFVVILDILSNYNRYGLC